MTKSTLALALALLMADPDKPPSAREPPVPPGLTVSALREELGRARPGEPASGEQDRERLTVLLAELARAREAIRAETARLEALIRKASAAGLSESAPPDGPPAGQVEVVSRALRGMAAQQAAAIVTHLDRNLAVEVLLRLRPPEAGAILALVKPELAAVLATDMARRPPLPEATRTRRRPEDLP
jgi:flagellar motility protein MotE (MotC chaperone)